jgi:hypothetical protein
VQREVIVSGHAHQKSGLGDTFQHDRTKDQPLKTRTNCQQHQRTFVRKCKEVFVTEALGGDPAKIAEPSQFDRIWNALASYGRSEKQM